eukprot:gb/GFBE01025650.1/.p1 GENE.gb/GFBE01025650.1/~~gb/GFBE01025650.1/.p1  ORF type:complete len:503 (+),score=71.17 gb/GFBE01025650.1/:1-1509(+)
MVPLSIRVSSRDLCASNISVKDGAATLTLALDVELNLRNLFSMLTKIESQEEPHKSDIVASEFSKWLDSMDGASCAEDGVSDAGCEVSDVEEPSRPDDVPSCEDAPPAPKEEPQMATSAEAVAAAASQPQKDVPGGADAPPASEPSKTPARAEAVKSTASPPPKADKADQPAAEAVRSVASQPPKADKPAAAAVSISTDAHPAASEAPTKATSSKATESTAAQPSKDASTSLCAPPSLPEAPRNATYAQAVQIAASQSSKVVPSSAVAAPPAAAQAPQTATYAQAAVSAAANKIPRDVQSSLLERHVASEAKKLTCAEVYDIASQTSEETHTMTRGSDGHGRELSWPASEPKPHGTRRIPGSELRAIAGPPGAGGRDSNASTPKFSQLHGLQRPTRRTDTAQSQKSELRWGPLSSLAQPVCQECQADSSMGCCSDCGKPSCRKCGYWCTNCTRSPPARQCGECWRRSKRIKYIDRRKQWCCDACCKPLSKRSSSPLMRESEF